MDQQASWAAMLTQSNQRQQGRKRQAHAMESRALQVDRIKVQLIEAAEAKNIDIAKHYYTELVRLFAEEAVEELRRLEELPEVERKVKSIEIQNAYHTNCATLAVAVDALLGVDHDII